jgi:MFS family permease
MSGERMSDDAAAGRQRWVPVSASAMGTVIEWYDFFLYSSAAVLVFNTQFFGDVSPIVGTMIAFATYAVGFVVRPLGGIVFGNIGDRVGRKPVLLATVLLMGLSTIAIGLLPNFAAIGYWAPALLILLRVVQGFGAGAEYGGAVVVAGESGRTRRGLFASIPGAAVDVAMLLATGVFALFTLLPRDQFDAWGWRVPFLLSVVGLGLAVFIRVRMPETEEFEKEVRHHTDRSPFRELWASHKRRLFIAAGVNFGGNLAYVFQTFALSYSINNLGYPPAVSLLGVVVSGLVGAAATVAWGALSDRVGRRPVIIGGALFLIAFIYPFFTLIELGVGMLYLAVAVAHVADRAIFGVQAPFYTELFPARVRFSGIATAREVTGALIGGPLPLVATALVVATGGSTWPVALLVIGLAATSALSAWLAPETNPDVARRGASDPAPTAA